MKKAVLSLLEARSRPRLLPGCASHLTEVFSPPRFVPEAERHGLIGAGSWDLRTGWGVFSHLDRARFWQALARDKPMLVTLGPECRAFSSLMRVSWDKMDADKAERLKRDGLEMLTFW